MRLKAIMGATLASVAFAGCGGAAEGDGSAGAGGGAARSQEAQDAMLRFAQCMREQGLDVGDPGEDGLVRVSPRRGERGEPENPEKFRRAEQKCGRHMREAGPPPELSQERQHEFERKAVAFARCMREQGIDIPDPETDGRGGVMQELPEGADPESARFREAEEECRGVAPGPPEIVEATP